MQKLQQPEERHDVGSHQKIRFAFENTRGETEVESLWAIERQEGYEIDNIPFYAQSVACGDIVSVQQDESGLLWFSSLVAAGGHSTIRLLFVREEDVARARDQLRTMGCASEVSDLRSLVAVDVPPAANYESVKTFLDSGEREGCFEYEEACLAHQLIE